MPSGLVAGSVLPHPKLVGSSLGWAQTKLKLNLRHPQYLVTFFLLRNI